LEGYSVLSEDPGQARSVALTAAILVRAPPYFVDAWEALFRYSLDQRDASKGGEEDDDNDEDEMNNDESGNEDMAWLEHESQLFHNLRKLGWPNGFLEQPLVRALHRTIFNKVKTIIAGDFETGDLYSGILDWKSTTIDPWLHDCFGIDVETAALWIHRLDDAPAEAFCLVRMEELFELVADYPDSHPAVLELRPLLARTRMYPALGEALQASLIRRLHHPGANTSQIIDVYMNTIQVLRVLDPSDRLLQVVAEPVRSYLRGRPDTVRCIISSLTDPQLGGDLYQELRRQDAKPLENVLVDSDDEEEPPDEHWQPPPSLYKPRGTFLEGSSRPGDGDILAMLVSIYGSKDLFVNEYRLMLADKLLANLDYHTDTEVHTLELLKLRFGEASMRNCEVMIKDMDDSKRTNTNIHSTTAASSNRPSLVDAAIVSHIFWPSLQKEALIHHPRIQSHLDQFSHAYSHLKNPRKLVWLNQLGTVQVSSHCGLFELVVYFYINLTHVPCCLPFCSLNWMSWKKDQMEL
jgi:anaphase-promoting complex subunit 2